MYVFEICVGSCLARDWVTTLTSLRRGLVTLRLCVILKYMLC